MRNIYITITVAIFCTVLFSCTTHQISVSVRKQKAGTGDNLGNMENGIWRKGYMLAKTECTGCHRFYSPEEHSPEEWNGIIKGKVKRLSLGRDQVDALDVYFQSESGRSK